MRRINAMGKQILFLLFICSIFIVQAEENRVIVGAERTAEYYPLLEGKRVAVFSNHTGMIGNRHLVDVLVGEGLNVVTIFSPEHLRDQFALLCRPTVGIDQRRAYLVPD